MTNPAFETVRQLLGEGEVDRAIQFLLEYLQKEGGPEEALRTLRTTQSNYNNARRRESSNIINFQEAQREYALASDAVQIIMDDLEAGRYKSRPEPSTGPARRIPVWAYAAGGLAVLLAGWLLLFKKGARPQTAVPEPRETSCPNFPDSAKKVLLLPFQSLSGGEARPELIIQTRIRDLTQKNNFPASAQILTNFDVKNENIDDGKALELGRKCSADMVVWGLYDKASDSIRLDVNYVFTQTGRAGGTGILPLGNLPEFRSGRRISRFDDAIFSLCGLLALHGRDKELAMKWFNKIQKPSDADRRIMEWMKTAEKPDGKIIRSLKNKREQSTTK